MAHPKKRSGLGLEMRTFTGKKSKTTYLVVRTPKRFGHSYHVFVEQQAKAAARDCGAAEDQTNEMWSKVWESN